MQHHDGPICRRQEAVLQQILRFAQDDRKTKDDGEYPK